MVEYGFIMKKKTFKWKAPGIEVGGLDHDGQQNLLGTVWKDGEYLPPEPSSPELLEEDEEWWDKYARGGYAEPWPEDDEFLKHWPYAKPRSKYTVKILLCIAFILTALTGWFWFFA